jgi:hypothetical protein
LLIFYNNERSVSRFLLKAGFPVNLNTVLGVSMIEVRELGKRCGNAGAVGDVPFSMGKAAIMRIPGLGCPMGIKRRRMYE